MRFVLTLLLMLVAAPAWAGPFEDAAAANARDDYAAELRITRPLAAKGEAWAQSSLGDSYRDGDGVPKNDAEAVKWYRLAAAQGYAAAQSNLGAMYGHGQGVLQDYAEAVKWFRLAAAQGDALAQFNLGLLYLNGQGVKKNDTEAVKWFRLAAAQGYALAQVNLAAVKGDADAVKNRDIAASKMTPQQMAEAQKLALNAHTFTGRVIAVADGDTITVLRGNTQVKVRLTEIDAPEKKQAFGNRSKQSLSDLCFGKAAVLVEKGKDRYGRTLARVTCEGADANAEQVRRGLAWAYTRYLTDPQIRVIEGDARTSRRGLWQDDKPVPPWEWRKEKR